ncbi:hypothetical protein [Flavobacterium aestivum]|uniref:hypothetical protein n=1 Tax=Flavobacterium aestivum TaxID=3003257 RepID=UPI0022866874|nr:hypothetical protein [Flavobacterium aestivum]
MKTLKKLKKLNKRLEKLEEIITSDCITITNSENDKEQITLSFVNGVVAFKKITKTEIIETKDISEVTFN